MSLYVNGYATLFQVEHMEKFTKASLSTSRKNKDGQYENSHFNAIFVGNQLEEARRFMDKDRIKIINGNISDGKPYEKQGVTIYPKNVVVFEFEKLVHSNNKDKNPQDQNEFDFGEAGDDPF